jgi:hypothetical protein
VGNGAQQRAAHLLSLHADARGFGEMLAARPLDGQCRLGGEDLEKLHLSGCQHAILRDGKESQNADYFPRAFQGQIETPDARQRFHSLARLFAVRVYPLSDCLLRGRDG